jgi:hypothetical protein
MDGISVIYPTGVDKNFIAARIFITTRLFITARFFITTTNELKFKFNKHLTTKTIDITIFYKY